MGTAAALAEEDIAGLSTQARSDFKPVNEQQLAKARTELRGRMKDVEQFIRPSTENGKRWARYLRWDALKEQVAADRPKDLAAFDVTLRQLNRNENGLENPRFRRIANAVRRYRDALAVSMWENPAEIYGRQLDALTRDLDAYHKEPSPRTEMALSERLRIVDSIGQAPKLVDARCVAIWLGRMRMLILPTSYVASGVEPIDRSEPVTDCILGTNINADAHTTGKVSVASIPSENKAVLEFHSKGHVWSQNFGNNGPAVIRSTADTDFTATKRVEFTDPAFSTRSAQASATTDTHIHSISKRGGGLGSRLVSSIGWKKARQSEGQAEAIAADHAEGRIERKFNDEVNDEVQKARKRYEDEYRRPLERRGDLPDHIRFSSGKSSLDLEVVQANRSQLGAPGSPPDATEKHDVTMRLHESAVNNYSSSILGGATARQTKPDEDIKFNVALPKWMKKMWENRKTEATDNAAEEEPFKQYALTFREDRPLSVNFAGDKG